MNEINTMVQHPALVNFSNVQIYRIKNDLADSEENKSITGFLLSFRKLTRRASVYIRNVFPALTISNECVVELSDAVCWSPALVGTEASFLSKIKYFSSNEHMDSTTRLPGSIFLTSKAMDLYLQSKDNSSLRDRMEMLKHGIYETSNSLSETSLQEEWENSVICKELFDILLWKIDSHKRYSIRSSVVCDNIWEFSASADQRSSYFGVEGILSVVHSLKMCWASAYSVEALKYRRDNGLPLDIKMGIIIQEMVDVDLYGILFTCRPSNNDPRVVSIDINSSSANEEVLALENPIVINKQNMKIQFTTNCLLIKSISDPSIDSSSDSDDLEEEALSVTQQSSHRTRKTSIYKKFLKLTEICLKFESIFSHMLNVEWGFIDDEIYIFICRPVTSTFTWSDFEISHELDSGFTEFDAITFHSYGSTLFSTLNTMLFSVFQYWLILFCNDLVYTWGLLATRNKPSRTMKFPSARMARRKEPTGINISLWNNMETLCDVSSPLNITFTNKIMEDALNINCRQIENVYHRKYLAVTQFHTGIDVCNGVFIHIFPEIPFFQSLIEMVMCGQVIVTEELYKLAQERNDISSTWSMFCTIVYIFKLWMKYNLYSSRAEKLAQEFKIDAKKYSCVESLFDIIIEKAELFSKIADYHFKVSNMSHILKCVTLWFMTVGEEENLQKHVINLSVKLEAVNTMSSELPALLKEIASLIEKYDKEKEYLNMSPTEKLQFHENYPRIRSKMQHLVKTFGFRCMKEMDLMSETWSMNFSPILKNIDILISKKNELGCAATSQQSTSLVCSRRYGKIVNYLIGRTKVALANREKTKKSLLLVLHQFRLAFLQLGNMLAQDVKIPSANLVFYFTLSELKQIVENDGARSIIHKGYRRYRLWNQIESLQFDDVIIGLPQPRRKDFMHVNACVLRGIAVSYHSAIGKANVLLRKNNMKNVNPGDIIITRNIDASWSLYFPIIAGLVTEFGGMMSRGAIAARECGLPCIVGVKNATSCIETGDIISINGIDGIVSKLL